jgi:hypothetical protein
MELVNGSFDACGQRVLSRRTFALFSAKCRRNYPCRSEFQSFVRPYGATLLTMIKIVLIPPFHS